MPFGRCDCHECNSAIQRLEGQIRSLELDLDALKRDLQREVDDRRSAVRMLSDDLASVGS